MPEGFTKLNNRFLEELLTRNLTRNQQNILRFIFRLSLGCNRSYALIPKLRYFEKCGVVRTRAKGELKTLADKKVITWNQPMNTYAINFNYQEWEIGHYKISEDFDQSEYQDLIHLQLTNRSHDEMNKPMVCEIIDEKRTNITKCKLFVRKYQPGNPFKEIQNVKKVDKMSTQKFTKCQLFKPASLTDSKREGFPKDSIKDIKRFKDKEQQNTPNQKPSQEQIQTNVFLEIRRFWERNIHFHPPDMTMERIAAEIDQTRFIDKEIILEAIKESVKNNAKAHWPYSLKIIRTWEQAGIQTLADLENYRGQEEQRNATNPDKQIHQHGRSNGRLAEKSQRTAAALAELQRRERENVSQEQLEQWEREKQELLAQMQ